MSGEADDLSIGKLAVFSLGSAVGVLVLATVLIVVVEPGPGVSLVIALVGVVGAVAAMAFVSKRMTRRAYGDDSDPKPGSGA